MPKAPTPMAPAASPIVMIDTFRSKARSAFRLESKINSTISCVDCTLLCYIYETSGEGYRLTTTNDHVVTLIHNFFYLLCEGFQKHLQVFVFIQPSGYGTFLVRKIHCGKIFIYSHRKSQQQP